MGVLLLAGLVWWWAWEGDAPRRRGARARPVRGAVGEAAVPARVAQVMESPAPAAAAAVATSEALPYRIVEVSVEPARICRDQQVVVRMRAEHDEGRAEWLLPLIGGKLGWQVALVLPGAAPGRVEIPVSIGEPLTGGRVTGAGVVEVMDCEARGAALWLAADQAGEREEAVRFTGRFAAGREAAARFGWDFGDGSARVTTTEVRARHDFPDEEARGPGRRISTYLVRVEALSARGEVLARGVIDVSFRNRFEELEESDGRVQLEVLYQPHPRVTADGDQVIEVTLKNLAAEESARLEALEYRLVPCAPGEVARQVHPVSDVFAEAVVPARGSVRGQLRWPRGARRDVCNVDVSVRGRSEPGGLGVGGVFSMRTRVEVGQGAVAVTDPAQVAALERAVGLLGGGPGAVVTREQLERLADEGQLERLDWTPPRPPPLGAGVGAGAQDGSSMMSMGSLGSSR